MLQLLVALILFTEASLNQPSVLVRGRLANRSCPDEDLAILCDGHCYTAYLACKDNCDSSSCERTCLTSYTTCYSDCPCFDNCPNGCDGCPNPICTCNEPQKNNIFYIQCMDQAVDMFRSCILNSTAGRSSYDLCYENFTMASEKCPCNSGCETGCPCESGFKCQENIMAMCQMRGSGNTNPVNYTYVISADGFFQENRHFLSPQSSGPSSYYPFLYQAGSALLNGEIYFFGGNHDTKKIAKIESCEIVDTGKRLLQTFYSYYGSTVTVPELHDEVVLCQGYPYTTSGACETFDGENSVQIPNTKNEHRQACMALVNNQATIIAGQTTATVETLAISGWTPEPSHPAGLANSKYFYHACVSVEDGIITTGGTTDESTYLKSVFFFQNEEWKLVGELSNTFKWGSMIAVEGAFLVFSGSGQRYIFENQSKIYAFSNMVERARDRRNSNQCFLIDGF